VQQPSLFKNTSCFLLTITSLYIPIFGARDGAVVEALRYKPEGRGIPDGVNGIFH
jgi:hypothetical protein